MLWLLYTFISLLSRALYGVLSKVLSGKVEVSAYTQATALALSCAVVSVLVSPAIGGLHFGLQGVSLVAVAFVMLGQGFGNILYFTAIRSLTNGTAQITFSSILIFNTVLAVLFMNLTLTVLNILGVMLLLVAIVSVVTGRIELNRRGVTLMTVAALMFSVFQLASAELSPQMSAVQYLLISYLGCALVIVLLKANAILQDIRTVNLSAVWKISFLAAIPSVGNFLFAYYAYRAAPEPAKVAMLLTAQVVVAVILSYFLLKEKGHVLRKLTAAIMVAISAVLIKN